MRTSMTAAALLCLLAGASASHVECQLTTSQADVAAAGYYVAEDCGISDMCVFSLWIYEESNGIDGLQRRDDWKDDTCRGKWPSDTIIF